MAHIDHAIVGDPKYFNKENWQLPGGLQNRLHLLARRIVIPHPRGGVIDATAPLPPHMLQSWNLLGLEHDRFDPIENAPEERSCSTRARRCADEDRRSASGSPILAGFDLVVALWTRRFQ